VVFNATRICERDLPNLLLKKKLPIELVNALKFFSDDAAKGVF
jgi:hypothetical protein